MGIRFRKSINFGGFRVNLSKKGIGYSMGCKGMRYTKKANGGTRKTLGIPGTGLSYAKDSKGGNWGLGKMLIVGPFAAVYYITKYTIIGGIKLTKFGIKKYKERKENNEQ